MISGQPRGPGMVPLCLWWVDGACLRPRSTARNPLHRGPASGKSASLANHALGVVAAGWLKSTPDPRSPKDGGDRPLVLIDTGQKRRCCPLVGRLASQIPDKNYRWEAHCDQKHDLPRDGAQTPAQKRYAQFNASTATRTKRVVTPIRQSGSRSGLPSRTAIPDTTPPASRPTQPIAATGFSIAAVLRSKVASAAAERAVPQPRHGMPRTVLRGQEGATSNRPGARGERARRKTAVANQSSPRW